MPVGTKGVCALTLVLDRPPDRRHTRALGQKRRRKSPLASGVRGIARAVERIARGETTWNGSSGRSPLAYSRRP
jgi:hypothetical protein